MWYFVLCSGGRRELVGNGGFKGAPEQGLVELGYSILPQHQRKGYATKATLALIAWAFSHREVDRVCAETLPDLEPSLGVMRKCGMRYVGPGRGDEGMQTVHYEIGRLDWKMRSGGRRCGAVGGRRTGQIGERPHHLTLPHRTIALGCVDLLAVPTLTLAAQS